MPTILKVTSDKELLPVKGVWYDLHGVLFVSVIRKSNPYVRIKSTVDYDKVDNSMSDWHREWQYEKIEGLYGTEVCGIRTFEKVIFVDDIEHRIDSVVENTAIEFQHTLSVSIEEMDSRFHAHKKHGYTPYLVIDLTAFSYEDVFEAIKHCESKSSDYLDKRSLNTIKKWKGTAYAQENNLFLDLKDCMVRVVDFLGDKSVKLSVQHFTDNLSGLEDELRSCREAETDRLNRERQAELERELMVRSIVEEREKEIADKQRLETEMAQKRAAEKSWGRYMIEKEEGSDFRFYRYCRADAEIKPYVIPHDREIFEYWSHDYPEDDEFEAGYRVHEYKSTESKFSMSYKVVMKVEEEKIYGRSKWSRVPNYAVIELKEGYRVLKEFVRPYPKGKRN